MTQIKSVLVTGAKGFIGKNLVQKLLNQKIFKVIEFDIEDGDIANQEFQYEEIDHIIHLAGKTYVPDSWKFPFNFYRTNFLGTINILELCRKLNCPLTYISAYVYGEPEYLPIDENHPLKAANPYMHSKLQAESACSFYATNYDVPITVVRPFNIYGPNQSPNFLIPKIIDQVKSKSNEIKVFSLDSKRDYIYIDDFTEAIIKAIDLNIDYQVLNIGSGKSYSVKEIIDFCQDIAGTNKKVISENINRKNEIMDVFADIKKAVNVLKWNPSFSIKEGLKETINYEGM